MKIKVTNLKDTSKERLFKNVPALRRLLKIKGYSKDLSFENYFVGLLMTSKTKGIYIRHGHMTNGLLECVSPVVYKNNTFHIK